MVREVLFSRSSNDSLQEMTLSYKSVIAFNHSTDSILSELYNILPVLFLTIMTLIILQGCGTLPNGRRWGEDATLTPGWNRIKESVIKATLSPETWGPVAISMGLMIDEADERVSDWASNSNPLFGSLENAAKWSDYLAYASGAAYFITSLATPSGDNPSEWLEAKAKGLALGVAVSGITAGSTELIKDISGRPRPDESNDKSFPSDHASTAAVFTTLARRNLKLLSLSPRNKIFTDICITATAVGTGWARVEANKHNPSDVLAGYALGHFLSAFINDAFLGLDNGKAPLLNIEPSDKGISISLNGSF